MELTCPRKARAGDKVDVLPPSFAAPAVAPVAVGRHQVGHLPKDLAIDYARGLGALAARGLLATGEARLWAVNEKGVIRARVTILIPEAEAFE